MEGSSHLPGATVKRLGLGLALGLGFGLGLGLGLGLGSGSGLGLGLGLGLGQGLGLVHLTAPRCDGEAVGEAGWAESLGQIV